MGEPQGWLFEPSFNRSVKVTASDERITSDAGLVLLREADHRLGITESLAQRLVDPRQHDLIRYQLVELLRADLCLGPGLLGPGRRRSSGPRSGHEVGRSGIVPASNHSKSAWPVSPRSRG